MTHGIQRHPQGMVRPDATGDHHGGQAGLLQRASTFFNQDIHNRGLGAGRQIGQRWGLRRLTQGAPTRRHRRFKARKRKIEVGLVQQRPGQGVGASVALLRQSGQGGPAGVGQPQQFGAFVKRLAGCIVYGLPQQLVAPHTVYRHQLGVPAGDQQGQKRKTQLGLPNKRRQQVSLEVMHRHQGHPPRLGQARGKARTHQQRASQPRACGYRHRANLLRTHPGLVQHLLRQWHQALDMVAAGEFRDHPTVRRMRGDLAVQRVRQQARRARAGVNQRHAGLVARGFNTQNPHGRSLRGRGRRPPSWRRVARIDQTGLRSLAKTGYNHRFARIRPGQPRLTEDTHPDMTTVRVKDNEPAEVALRRFKRSIEKLGLLTELRAREFYEKPTTERKRKKAAAVKRHLKRVRSMQLPKRMY